jgi:endoglucanase
LQTLLGSLLLFAGLGTPARAAEVAPPLSTKGASIVDASGRRVVLQGVNWFGFETSNHAPHGLWSRDYADVLAQVRRLGFNTIRLPFSLEALESRTITGVDFSGGKNAALKGTTPLQAMDAIVDEAARQHLLVLLDCHSLADDGYTDPLWYGQGGFTEDDWVAAWRLLAHRYATRPNVIGADLKNEPHGPATWGTGGPTDWRRAAERAGNAVTAIAPRWLIVVEGIEGRVPGQQLETHWWGGNLEGVRRAPVRLSRPGRLVYSPHEYGPGVFPQPWFSRPDMARVLADRWQEGFGYIAEQGIAPILVGEFGGREVGTDTVEGRWQRQFLDYLGERAFSWTYWALNPNSGDTGGVLADDWTSVNAAKMALLRDLIERRRIAFGAASRAPRPAPASPERVDPRAPAPRPTRTPAPPTPAPPERKDPGAPPPAGGPPRASVAVDSRWAEGWCAHLAITGRAGAALQRVRAAFTLPAGTRIAQSWNGTFSAATGRIRVGFPEWARTPHASTGFCVTGTGEARDPAVG